MNEPWKKQTWWCLPAVRLKVISLECLHTGQTQVSEARARIEEFNDALGDQVSARDLQRGRVMNKL